MNSEFNINLKLIWDSADSAQPAIYKSCMHSGNAGDIIYSLPTVKLLGAKHFIINLCTDPGFGGRNIDLDTATSLSSLLLEQDYIERVSIVQSNIPLEFLEGGINVNFILDKFRLQNIFQHHIAICHAQAFNLHINLFEKWLDVVEKGDKEDYIIVAFTPRYRSLSNEYWVSALSGLDNIKILGVSTEFFNMVGITADFITCKDFLEMARIISKAKLFIGNPSLIYSIAEALKVPRIIEIPESPRNAYPVGRNGYVASNSILETRDLIELLVANEPNEILQFKNTSLIKKMQQQKVQITTLSQGTNERNQHITNLEQEANERNQHITNLEQEVNEHNQHITSLGKHAANLEQERNNRDQHITNLDKHIVNLDQEISNRDEQITALHKSASWRVTRPLRYISSLVGKKKDNL